MSSCFIWHGHKRKIPFYHMAVEKGFDYFQKFNRKQTVLAGVIMALRVSNEGLFKRIDTLFLDMTLELNIISEINFFSKWAKSHFSNPS